MGRKTELRLFYPTHAQMGTVDLPKQVEPAPVTTCFWLLESFAQTILGSANQQKKSYFRFFLDESGAIGSSLQISSLYSFMVRSVENLPLFAVLMMLIRVQRS